MVCIFYYFSDISNSVENLISLKMTAVCSHKKQIIKEIHAKKRNPNLHLTESGSNTFGETIVQNGRVLAETSQS